jgi:8-oxo-dGTP diphosphatase
MDPAAIGIVSPSDQPDHVLWVKRKDCGIWVLPGGGIDQGETPEEAALRELMEETGVKGRIIRKAALLKPKNSLSADTHLFLCVAESALPSTPQSSEVSDAGYFLRQEPPKPYFPLHRDWMEEIASKGTYFERSIHELTFWNILRFFLKYPLLTCKYLWSRLKQGK